MIDLRSDTITTPTPEMREAIARAEVGDDVFGDDPTVRRLEQTTAELLGKAAAVYLPSGTMANQVAIRSHTEPGQEILIEGDAHIYYYEAGATAALSGVLCRCLPGERGVFTAAQLRAALRPPDVHFPPTRLVCVENTHNRGGGVVWPQQRLAEVCDAARDAGLALHLDGARLWNAAVASNCSEAELAAGFDTVSVCFSKGLGAPVGSVLAGTAELIDRARRFRKQFGGGMRQAGLLAAGALYALECHRGRLVEDHQHARVLAEGLAELDDIEIDVEAVQTNIVRFGCRSMDAARLSELLHEQGVRMLATGPDTLRAVCNLTVHAADIDTALGALGRCLQP